MVQLGLISLSTSLSLAHRVNYAEFLASAYVSGGGGPALGAALI
jgi:hypothetical protein